MHYIYLLPSDGYREIYVSGSFNAGNTVIDDGIENRTGRTAEGPVEIIGGSLELIPGEVSEIAWLSEGGDLHGVSVEYRPRQSKL